MSVGPIRVAGLRLVLDKLVDQLSRADNFHEVLVFTDLERVQELRTTELDASKSDLRASVNSSNLDISSNHPEFKKRISRDTSIERQDKSKALFG